MPRGDSAAVGSSGNSCSPGIVILSHRAGGRDGSGLVRQRRRGDSNASSAPSASGCPARYRRCHGQEAESAVGTPGDRPGPPLLRPGDPFGARPDRPPSRSAQKALRSRTLAEIAPCAVHPLYGISVRGMLDRLEETEGIVERLGDTDDATGHSTGRADRGNAVPDP